MALAEWAELVAAFPLDARPSRDVAEWLCAKQRADGAFPNTTASDFPYTRGTAKIFEVLTLRPADCARAADRALQWLRTLQYRPDAVFFVPEEHRDRILGGLRHDHRDTDAWIDAAGHLLVGLARLESDGARREEG
jgi:hypothetical protein